jgi:membrane protease YdiL (CAAX protease family)
MNKGQLRVLAGSLIGGMVFFFGVIYFTIATTMYNAQWTPGFVWFPIVTLGVLVVATIWVQRHWDIGLSMASNVPWGRVWALAITVTIAGTAVSTLQGVYNETTKEVYTGPAGVSPALVLFYVYSMSIMPGLIAEVGFRGIMQTGLQKFLGMWAAITIVAIINTFAHIGYADLRTGWLMVVILACWGYLRAVSGSLIPALVAHGGHALIITTALWFWGPWDRGDMGTASVVSVAIIGIIAFALSFYLGRSIMAHRDASALPVSKST